MTELKVKDWRLWQPGIFDEDSNRQCRVYRDGRGFTVRRRRPCTWPECDCPRWNPPAAREDRQ